MDSNNDTPEPGTYEYDEHMRAKYRGQGRKEDPFNMASDGQRMGVKTVVGHGDKDPVSGNTDRMGLSVRTDSTLGPEFGRARLDPYQVEEMKAEMARLEVAAEEIAGYDPKTGEPIYRLQGVMLEAQQRRYAMLKGQLPLLEAAIAQQQAERGTREENTVAKLIAEKKRQDDIRARAEYIAMEREAQAMADRIAKQRKADRG